MTDTTRPALTPEEWDGFERYGWEATVLRDGYPGGNNHRVSASCTTRGEMRVQKFGMHALAALALHGQPFGFTREDVQVLREEAEAECNGAETYHGRYFLALAARIEALLPPEAP